MKIIVTMIPIDLYANLLLSSFCPSYKPKTKIRFSASWWSGNEKYFCFLFIASPLLQSYAEFNRLIPVRIIVPWFRDNNLKNQAYYYMYIFFNNGLHL